MSLATLKRYLKQRREIGEVIPKPIPGRPAKKGDALDAGLAKQLQHILLRRCKSSVSCGKVPMVCT